MDVLTPAEESGGEEADIIAGLGMDEAELEEAWILPPRLVTPLRPPRIPPRPRLFFAGDSSGAEAGAAGGSATVDEVAGGVVAAEVRARLEGGLLASADAIEARLAPTIGVFVCHGPRACCCGCWGCWGCCGC